MQFASTDGTAVWGQDANSWDGDFDNSVDEGLHDRTIKCAAPIQSDAEQQIRAFLLPAAKPLDSSEQEYRLCRDVERALGLIGLSLTGQVSYRQA